MTTPAIAPAADRIVRVPLLGLQCRDAVDRKVVDDGLQVTLVDRWRPGRVQRLAANRSGVFALHAAPGFAGFDDDGAGDSPAAADRWRLEVRDTQGRYVPAALAVALPGGGLVGPVHGSPGTPYLPLYSAVTRTPPPGLQRLFVELRDATLAPAAWARLELRLDGETLAEGIADAAGRAQLVFPLPRPRDAALCASPPQPAPLPTWDVTLHAFWSGALAPDTVPDRADVMAQAAAALCDSASLATPLPPQTLHADEPLVVRGRPSPFVFVAA